MNMQDSNSPLSSFSDLSDIDFGEQTDEASAIFQKLVQDIDDAEEEFGEEAVAMALETLLPGFDIEELEGMEVQGVVEESIGTALKGIFNFAGKNSRRMINWVKGFTTKSGRAARAKARKEAAKQKAKDAAGTAAAAGGVGAGTVAAAEVGGSVLDTAGDIAGDIMTRKIDQDVTIDGVTTDDALNVSSQKLEDLLMQTNDALSQITQTMLDTQKALGIKLDNIDDNQDDLIAAETGETPGQVKSRQGVSGATAAPKKPSKKKDKQSKKGEPVVTSPVEPAEKEKAAE